MKLEIRQGNSSSTYFAKTGVLHVRVGSAPDSDIVIAEASALHCKLESFMGKWSVTDQMSDTGTKVNGENVYTAELKVGDVISIGNATISVAGMDAREAAAARNSEPAVPMAAPPGLSFKEQVLTPLVGQPEPITLRAATPVEFAAAVKLDAPPRQPPKPRPEPTQAKSPQELFAEDLARPRAQVASYRPPEKKKGNPIGVFIAMGIVFCFVMVVVGAISDATSEMDSEFANAMREAEERTRPSATPAGDSGTSRDATRDKEYAYKQKISALTSRTNKDPYEKRLAALDAIEEELKAFRHSLQYVVENARIYLEQGLLTVMSRRSSKDQTEIFDLIEKKDFKTALARLEALKAYGNETPYHKKLSESAGIKGYVDEKIEDTQRRNLDFITQSVVAVDEALTLNDFARAVSRLETLVASARLEKDVELALNDELKKLRGFAADQAAGKIEAPKKPFDKRKDKLPPAPKSSLLPEGDGSFWQHVNPLASRLLKEARAGELKDAATEVHGQSAKLAGADSYRLKLMIERKLADGLPLYLELFEQPSRLPPATIIRLYEALPNPTRQNRIGMLLYCYEYGLLSDAPRLAWKLWQSDKSVKAELDQLMAAKLGIEVPEGGFIERDSTLVPK